MKRILLALMLGAVLSAPAAAQIPDELELRYEKMNADTTALSDTLINGAQRSLVRSAPKADQLAAIESLRDMYRQAETAFQGTPPLKACSLHQGPPHANSGVCDPVATLKKEMDREFMRLGWPVAPTPSAAYDWMLEQFRYGPAEMPEAVRSFADYDAMRLLSVKPLLQVEHSKIVAELAVSREKVREDYAAKQEYNSTIVGNFSSMGERFQEAIGVLFSTLIFAFAWPLVAAFPVIGQWLYLLLSRGFGQGNVSGGLFLLFFAMIPMSALYVAFGGFVSNLNLGMAHFPVMITLYVGGAVLVQRSRFYAAIWDKAGAFKRFLATPYQRAARPSGSPSPAPAAPVGAAGGLHGSAHWSDAASAVAQGRIKPENAPLQDSHGFAVGRLHTGKGYDSRLRYGGHVLTIAPNGSGKGIGTVIPTLLEYPGSTIVLDVKGENYAVTARFRREQLGHDVYLLDPYGVVQGESDEKVVTHAFNWLDRLDPDSPDVVGESATLANLLVVSEGAKSANSANSDHFNETAKTFLRGLLVHVATLDKEFRNMSHVRALLTGDDKAFVDLLIAMKMNKRGQELPQRAANSIMATPEKERGSILSTCRRHLDFLDDPRLAAALSRSDFTLDDLKRKKMTIYLVVQPARLETAAAFARVFFGQAINAVMQGADKPPYRVLFLMDEFPQLGRMSIVEEKLPLIRGYGGAFWLIAQNLAQLKETYPRWQNFVANCGAKQFFGTADIETAKYVSDSLGKTTLEFQTKGQNLSAGSSISAGNSQNQQFTGRDLLTADEIMRIPREQAIVLVTGEAPYLLNRLNYLLDGEYAGRFDENPYERKKG